MFQLAEANIKKSKSVVTSMLSIAKHLSESFWIKAWELSDLIHSLGPCNIVGKGSITKFQAVRGYAPDLNSIILLPFGQPVEFHIPKGERGTFHEKSRAGSYVGASLDHPGSIQVWSHNTRRIITSASFKVKHVIPDPDVTFGRKMFCDLDDLSESFVSDLRDPTNLPGPITRGRAAEIDRIADADADLLSQEGDRISENNTIGQDVPIGDDVSLLTVITPVQSSPSQEGDAPTRTYAQALLTAPKPPDGISGLSQEGASKSSQEGGTSSGPRTRSQSRTSSLNSTHSIPQVLTSVSALRQSSRIQNKPVVKYNSDAPPIRDCNNFRVLLKGRRINGKAVVGIAIGPSTMQNAGHGLIATKLIKESTRICSYGKRYEPNSIYPRIYDTVFSDTNGMAIGDRDKDYGAWCNDPLDTEKVNCVIDYDADNQIYVVRARWDIQQHEELFIDYGEEYWRESY